MLYDRAEIEAVAAELEASDPEAARLFLALAALWDSAVRPLLASGGARLVTLADRDGDGAVSPEEVRELAAIIAGGVGTAFAASAVAALLDRLPAAYRRHMEAGVREARAALPESVGARIAVRIGGPDEGAIAWLARHNAYWIQSHYGRKVEDAIQSAGTEVLRRGLRRRDAGIYFAETLGTEYRNGMRYWRLLAGVVSTRSATLARLSSYEAAGLADSLALSAVNDERTSCACDFLDGRRFAPGAALAARTRLLSVSEPAAVKDASPWWANEADCARLRTLVHAAGGRIPAEVGLPGYHPHCRSVLTPKP